MVRLEFPDALSHLDCFVYLHSISPQRPDQSTMLFIELLRSTFKYLSHIVFYNDPKASADELQVVRSEKYDCKEVCVNY